jgi:hypothetical protein
MVDAFLQSQTTAWDNLFASRSQEPLPVEKTLLSGENRARGALLGEIQRAIGAVADPAPANTGNGTLTNEAMKKDTKVGAYIVTMLTATTFKVVDPDGNRLGDGVAGTTYDNEQITFDVTAGGTPFIAGDDFSVTVDDGPKDSDNEYKLQLVEDTAVDGSRVPRWILAEAKDATAEDKVIIAYKKGIYNQEAVTFGASYTVAELKTLLDSMPELDIQLREVVKK